LCPARSWKLTRHSSRGHLRGAARWQWHQAGVDDDRLRRAGRDRTAAAETDEPATTAWPAPSIHRARREGEHRVPRPGGNVFRERHGPVARHTAARGDVDVAP